MHTTGLDLVGVEPPDRQRRQEALLDGEPSSGATPVERWVRAICGTPPAASKNRAAPSKVCWRSTDVVNHHVRQRDQHKITPKHHSTGPSPTDWDHPEQSNWASSPGAVSIGTEAPSERRNRGPRCSRTQRTTDGYEPVNPSAEMISNNDIANRFLSPTSSALSRSAHTGSTTRSPSATVRAAGGPPARTHFEIVAG